MNKYINFFLLISLLTFISCHIPPSREIQNKDFIEISSLIESSDRILNLSFEGEKIEYQIQDEMYVSLEFIVQEKFIGSSKKGEKIYVTLNKNYYDNLVNNNEDKFEFEIKNNYLFFLFGRAKKNIFPKELGGSLWFNNGNPSIYEIKDDRIKIISKKEVLSSLSDEFQEVELNSYFLFRDMIIEAINKWKIFLYYMVL